MKFLTIPTLAALALAANTAAANEFEQPLTDLANSEIKAWTQEATVIDAVKQQNEEHAGLSQAKIEELDQTWRSQVGSGGDLIARVTGNELSGYLTQVKEDGQGLYTEIFVTDNKGLNVGQSDVTSDYWQGDEAKWKVPFNEQKLQIGAVELDESTQVYQSQVSAPVVDPDSGAVIGAITVGVDVEQLVQ